MQHGTAREFIRDIVENVHAVLEGERRRGRPYGDLTANLRLALLALEINQDIDTPGVYGADFNSTFAPHDLGGEG